MNRPLTLNQLVAQGIEQLVGQQTNPLFGTVFAALRPTIKRELRRNLGPRAMPDLNAALKNARKQPHEQQAPLPKQTGFASRADALKVLDLPPAATNAEVKAAYREACIQYHPDKVMNLSPAFQKLADEQMKKLNAAYQFLKGGAK